MTLACRDRSTEGFTNVHQFLPRRRGSAIQRLDLLVSIRAYFVERPHFHSHVMVVDRVCEGGELVIAESSSTMNGPVERSVTVSPLGEDYQFHHHAIHPNYDNLALVHIAEHNNPFGVWSVRNR